MRQRYRLAPLYKHYKWSAETSYWYIHVVEVQFLSTSPIHRIKSSPSICHDNIDSIIVSGGCVNLCVSSTSRQVYFLSHSD